MISVYSDGSSTGRNNKPGGYGFVVVEEGVVLTWSFGGSARTTNNLMEMEGAIRGLEAVLAMGLVQPWKAIELVSDSKYTLGMASGSYSPTKNLDSVARLRDAAVKTGCRLRWVHGHRGDTYNEMCDRLAKLGKSLHT